MRACGRRGGVGWGGGVVVLSSKAPYMAIINFKDVKQNSKKNKNLTSSMLKSRTSL